MNYRVCSQTQTNWYTRVLGFGHILGFGRKDYILSNSDYILSNLDYLFWVWDVFQVEKVCTINHTTQAVFTTQNSFFFPLPLHPQTKSILVSFQNFWVLEDLALGVTGFGRIHCGIRLARSECMLQYKKFRKS